MSDPKRRRYLKASGRTGGPGNVSRNACEIEFKQNYNGSGPGAFGGAKDWPVLSVHLSFAADDFLKREIVATELITILQRHFQFETLLPEDQL